MKLDKIEEIPYLQKNQLFGEILSLLMSSKLHQKYRVLDIMNNILPAINLDQFKLYKKGDVPVAFISWANLDEATEKKYINKQYDIQIEDWNKGDKLWFIDFICYGVDIKEIENDLKNNIFPSKIVRALRADESGKVKRIEEYKGGNL